MRSFDQSCTTVRLPQVDCARYSYDTENSFLSGIDFGLNTNMALSVYDKLIKAVT